MQKPTPDVLDGSTRLLKGLADPVRLRLLSLLTGDREVCVCHLHEALELPQPTVSRHLAYLRKCGLVVGRKEGLWVYYRLAKPGGDFHRALIGGVGDCLAGTGVFVGDRRRLEGLISCRERG